MADSTDLSLRRFWRPRFWPVWLSLLCLRLIALLGFRAQIRLGRRFGRLLGRIQRRQNKIARRNLEVCFPRLDEAARKTLLLRHFESIGLSFVEMAIGWYSPLAKLRRLVDVRGLENLEAALAKGKGALLVGAHFTPLETCVAALEDVGEGFSIMYRPQRNPMMDVMIRRGRRRFAHTQIARDNVRALLKSLKRNAAVIYFPDQTYLGNQSELLPFFGEPALTNTATSKLAQISGAAVLPFHYRRRNDDSGYLVEIGAALEAFPSTDAGADTRRLVAILERDIEIAPEQYLWVYKKFKRRPIGFADLYDS
jgi:Kdo2-lipid IVA lauroyltransferase/acyltransferase